MNLVYCAYFLDTVHVQCTCISSCKIYCDCRYCVMRIFSYSTQFLYQSKRLGNPAVASASMILWLNHAIFLINMRTCHDSHKLLFWILLMINQPINLFNLWQNFYGLYKAINECAASDSIKCLSSQCRDPRRKATLRETVIGNKMFITIFNRVGPSYAITRTVCSLSIQSVDIRARRDRGIDRSPLSLLMRIILSLFGRCV